MDQSLGSKIPAKNLKLVFNHIRNTLNNEREIRDHEMVAGPSLFSSVPQFLPVGPVHKEKFLVRIWGVG